MNRLRLFGGAVVDTGSGPITGRAAQRHRIALLALLATTRRLHRSRDQLVTLLWPETDAERGRKLLSDSIYRVNRALGGDAVTSAGDEVRLNRGQLVSDVADFEAAIEARGWNRAAALYAGPFLDGFYLPGAPEFDQWMENERAHYARAAAKALEAIAVALRNAGQLAESVEGWQRLADLVPDDSRVAMELMAVLEASSNRPAALRHARLHAALLRDTYGLEPDRSLIELAERIGARNEVIPIVAPPEPASSSTNAIAVLPFTTVSDAEASSYFADGVSEELMYLLTRNRALRVASRTSSFACRDLKLDVREVAQRLGVSWILEGSVRRAGDRLRIVAQLIDARSGYQVWSESFDRTSNDIFSIQAEIAGAIVSRLAPALGGNVRGEATTASCGASDAETYDVYLQARYQWHRRTEDSLRHAVAQFEQVVARDTNYARAWSGLADAYAVMAFYDYLPPHVAFPRADAAARHAIQLDPALAAPYATLAYVDTYYRWDWAAAERGFQRAIELEPTHSTAHQWYGNLLTARSHFSEAEREMRRAAELDPLSMIAHSALGWVLMFANENERAIQQLTNALRLDPSFCLAHYWMGLAFIRSGDPRSAVPFLTRSLELSRGSTDDNALGLAALARAYASAGETGVAQGILTSLLEREQRGEYISSFQLGKVHLALGDIPASLARLERAFTDRAHSMVFLMVDRQLSPLAHEPRFQALVAQVRDTGHG